MRRRLCALALLVPLARPAAAEPPEWEEATESPPGWVLSPSARPGWVRVVGAGQSNLRELAYPLEPTDGTVREVVDEVAWRLRPVLGKEARAAADAVGEVVLARKAFHLHPARKGEPVRPGAAHYTVWALWETSVDPILVTLPPPKREPARAALELRTPTRAPAWEAVSEPPPYQATATSVRVPVRAASDQEAIAKADATTLAAEHVGGQLMRRLRELLGAADAWRVAREGTSWRSLVRRGVGKETPAKPGVEPRALAWTVWDVPLEPLLEAVPAKHRAAARERLVAPAADGK